MKEEPVGASVTPEAISPMVGSRQEAGSVSREASRPLARLLILAGVNRRRSIRARYAVRREVSASGRFQPNVKNNERSNRASANIVKGAVSSSRACGVVRARVLKGASQKTRGYIP